MANEFKIKNGMIVNDTQPVTGVVSGTIVDNARAIPTVHAVWDMGQTLQQNINAKLAKSDFQGYSAGIQGSLDKADSVYSTVNAYSADWEAGGALSAALDNNTNAHSAFLTHNQFNSYSGQVYIDQHTQDLAITGKVSTPTYTIGQHSQDLAITGKVSTDTYTVGQHAQDLAITGAAANASNALSAYVTLGTTQTISGRKTFQTPVTFNSNVRVEGVFTALSTVVIVSEVIGLSANYLTLNTNVTGIPTENAGINVNRGSSAKSQLMWNENDGCWQAGVSGSLENIVLSPDLDPINSSITRIDNETSAYLTHSQFESYSGQIVIDQHTQDLAITGKVSTGTYTIGQHAQDLEITGKVSTATYTIGQHSQDLAITGKLERGVFESYSGNVDAQLIVLSGMAETHYGNTGSRPTGITIGYEYFDTTLTYTIWWDGAYWVNATGARVD